MASERSPAKGGKMGTGLCTDVESELRKQEEYEVET